MLNQLTIRGAIVGICVAQCRGPDEVRQAVRNYVDSELREVIRNGLSLISDDSLNFCAPAFRRADGLKVAAIQGRVYIAGENHAEGIMCVASYHTRWVADKLINPVRIAYRDSPGRNSQGARIRSCATHVGCTSQGCLHGFRSEWTRQLPSSTHSEREV
jgi:hypothetical protein